MDPSNRIVVLIDMDCFYCQVEEKLNPELEGKPIAVVQYNPWKGGGIIAVNYVARAMGVTRHMRGDEAKEKCPEIQLPSVPCNRGKADISKYRDAGKEVATVLQKFTPLLERASIDEAYLDITAPVHERLKILNVHTVSSEMVPNTYALGYDSIEEFLADVHQGGADSIDFDYDNAVQLMVGAVIVSEIRTAVYEETGYQCSAGIAHNKILAKLVCGMNKPNKQTVLPKHSINILYKTLSVKKVKHLGGKFGDSVCEILKIKCMGDLQRFSEKELQARFDEKNGTWLYKIARGIDLEPVQPRFNPKSIGCCKQFRGNSALVSLDSLKKWLIDLGDEIEDRLEKDSLENNRTPRQMVVSFSTQLSDGRDTSSSRSYNFVVDDVLCGETFSTKSLELLIDSLEGVKVKDGEDNRRLRAPIKFLGISVGKFEDNSENKKTKKIKDYFGASTSTDVKSKVIKQNADKNVAVKNDKKHAGKDFLMRKFLQVPENKENNETKEKITLKQNNEDTENKLESTLDKQESFFAKFLNNANQEQDENDCKPNICINSKSSEIKIIESGRVSPICNKHEETSNDSNYSGSTIDAEINKSIALFEEDPEDVVRVSNMRQLLQSTRIEGDNDFPLEEEKILTETPTVKHDNLERKEPNDTIYNKEVIECSECGKIISIEALDVHADYHLALKLREEERQQVRIKIKERTNQKEVVNIKETKKNKTDEKSKNESSIANFLVKVDDTVPTTSCTECGKKVPQDKFQEHLDFHEAQKLSREINKRPVVNHIGSTTKRKRKSASPIKKPKVPCKSIDLFFR